MWGRMETRIAMIRAGMILLATCCLSACGLADTAVTGAAGAASEVEAARQGQQTERQVLERVEAAQRLDAERRRDAEASDGGG